jgi:hypothetical protein
MPHRGPLFGGLGFFTVRFEALEDLDVLLLVVPVVDMGVCVVPGVVRVITGGGVGW